MNPTRGLETAQPLLATSLKLIQKAVERGLRITRPLGTEVPSWNPSLMLIQKLL